MMLRTEAQQITRFMPGCTLDITPEAVAATAAARHPTAPAVV